MKTVATKMPGEIVECWRPETLSDYKKQHIELDVQVCDATKAQQHTNAKYITPTYLL